MALGFMLSYSWNCLGTLLKNPAQNLPEIFRTEGSNLALFLKAPWGQARGDILGSQTNGRAGSAAAL